MKLAEKIREILSPRASKTRIWEVRIGLIYTAVRTGDKEVGLAYTFMKRRGSCCPEPGKNSPLAGKTAAELLAGLGSGQKIESTLGLAVANSLAHHQKLNVIAGDILEIADLRPKDTVGMIGYFQPLVGPLQKRVSSLTIFEQDTGRDSKLLPEDKALELLPRCDVALITSTAIINGTIDNLLVAAQNCREVILLGASTPLVPEAFHNAPVTLLSGVVVNDPAEILRVVSEGGGMRQFKGLVQKVNLRLLK